MNVGRFLSDVKGLFARQAHLNSGQEGPPRPDRAIAKIRYVELEPVQIRIPEEMKSDWAKFITYNALVSMPIILAIPYLPSTVRGHDVFFPIIAGIFLSFLVVSLVTKRRVLPSILWGHFGLLERF
jgi:hypothetical protein